MKNKPALPARGRPRPRPLQGRAERSSPGEAAPQTIPQTDPPGPCPWPRPRGRAASSSRRAPFSRSAVQPSGCQARLNLTSLPHGRSPHQDAVSPGSRPRETCEVQRKNGPEYGAKGRGAQETPRGQDAHPPSPSPEPGCDSLMQRADFQEGPRC